MFIVSCLCPHGPLGLVSAGKAQVYLITSSVVQFQRDSMHRGVYIHNRRSESLQLNGDVEFERSRLLYP